MKAVDCLQVLLGVIGTAISLLPALADENEINIELSRQLKGDMARSKAPFSAISSSVSLLANLGLAVSTSTKLDEMERRLAARLTTSSTPRVGECALIRVTAWNNPITGETRTGDPVLYGVSDKPVNLLIEKEVAWIINGSVESRPEGREWTFDGNKTFYLCYTKTAEGKYLRGLVPYQTAIGQIKDSGGALIRRAYQEGYIRQKFDGAHSWICNFDKTSHNSPVDCSRPEMGGTWSTKTPTEPRQRSKQAGKSLSDALREP